VFKGRGRGLIVMAREIDRGPASARFFIASNASIHARGRGLIVIAAGVDRGPASARFFLCRRISISMPAARP